MAVKTIIIFTPCCSPGSSLTFEGDIPGLTNNNVYIYNGPPVVGTSTGTPLYDTLLTPQCYIFSRGSAPITSTFVAVTSTPLVIGNFALNVANPKNCATQNCIDACTAQPDNTWTPRFLIYSPCCGGPSLYFRVTDINGNYPGAVPSTGVALYIGPNYPATDGAGMSMPPGLITNTCYSITSSVVGPASFITSTAEYNNLQLAPPDNPSTYNYRSYINDNCAAFITECPTCNTSCYALWSCDGSIPVFTTNVDLSAYVGLNIVVTSVDPADNITSLCVFVEELANTTCTDPIDITIDPVIYCDCDCACYTVIGNATSINYIDCEGNFVQVLNPETYNQFCARAYPLVDAPIDETIVITNSGDCVQQQVLDPITCEENVEWVCPVKCYQLTECDNPTNIIYSTTAALEQIVLNNQIITIDGFTECWEVKESPIDCDCPINVTVLTVSSCCRVCKGDTNYKLTSCLNPNVFIYTSSDLSLYIDQTIIRKDCGGCWIVTEINTPIPTNTPIDVVQGFTNCDECERIHYLLTDCYNPLNTIITYTDLSAYLDQYIKLEWCPDTCWKVTTTTETENAGIVSDIQNSYEECIDCITDAKCICSTIKNYDAVIQTYSYINCYGQLQTVTLAPGQKSERICVIKWLVPESCNCLVLTETNGTITQNVVIYPSGEYQNNKPVWTFNDSIIYYDGTKWILETVSNNYYLESVVNLNCPVGTWHQSSSIPTQVTTVITTKECQNTIEYFGDCVNGICPPRKHTKKSVRPGYNTPACETWKYEEISCRAAEAMYRKVMELRYGISNCCGDDDEKYIIQKELVDLQALIPPAKITPVPPPPLISTVYTTFKAI